MNIIVTGGAGFIGSCFVLEWNETNIINIDKLTYAGSLTNLKDKKSGHEFIKADICDRTLIPELFEKHKPSAIINFAAETHVDRSIDDPSAFLETNVFGTFNLLQAALDYYVKHQPENFRFLHVSTDEVYGSLAKDAPAFTEKSPYAPNSPYSASKAASDHMVRAYYHTFGLPTIITNCSNNYGPRQYPEKLIPLMISHALSGKNMPVYGNGSNIRDWLYVSDHCSALRTALKKGKPGETYNIGGSCEKSNIDLVMTLCSLLDKKFPERAPRSTLITFVKDRAGHDFRYAIDTSKIKTELGWEPAHAFEDAFEKTLQWYIDNLEFIKIAA